MIDGSLAFYLKHSAVGGGWVVGLVGGRSICFNKEVENRVKLFLKHMSARIFQIHANFKKISDHEIKFLNKFRSVGSRPFLRLSSFQFLISRNYWQNIG